ncbi:MAG: bifunctional folylpolyglutamate synthase/dihydrofolate synthase [Rhizobiales bacterium]|nr:bifunctional folylpolyglutamate synthase/dihydrofolate synthase [Hyphomicrobiales bacterium]
MPSSSMILDRIVARGRPGIDLSLERIEAVLERLGSPHRELAPIIHVAGTNGKGSVIALMRAMFEAGGARVHVYTSPTLTTLHDQIVLAGMVISEAHLSACLARVEAAADGVPLTRFEAETAAAFVAFAEIPADVVLLETGLGGRLDATNVVMPRLTVITPISLDHAELLGDTVEAIAAEKAGIIKRGATCIVGPQSDAARAVLARACRRAGSRMLSAGEDFRAYFEHGRLVFQSETQLVDLPAPQLLGRHQVENAGTAIAAVLEFGLTGVTREAIAAGLRNVRWPGRLQRLDGLVNGLLPEGYEVWVDGSHNAAAAAAVASTMGDLEERSPKPLHICIAMLASKDPESFLEPFAGIASLVVALPVPPERLAHATAPGLPPERIAAAATGIGLDARVARDLCHALASSVAAGDGEVRLLICGSLHLVGHVLAIDGDDGSL